jgi:hypothetical protein
MFAAQFQLHSLQRKCKVSLQSEFAMFLRGANIPNWKTTRAPLANESRGVHNE